MTADEFASLKDGIKAKHGGDCIAHRLSLPALRMESRQSWGMTACGMEASLPALRMESRQSRVVPGDRSPIAKRLGGSDDLSSLYARG